MSRNQTDGGISQAMPTLVWTHSSNLQTCEHDPTITLNCPGNKQMEVWVSYWPSLVWTHSPKMQTCEHDLTITIKMSRKQTDGGMSQLLAIAGLDSQSEAPNMWAWSNDHTQMSRNQTDGGMSQLFAIGRLHSAVCHCCSGITVQRCKHVNMIQRPCSAVQETNRCRFKSSYANTGLDSQFKPPNMWAWSNNHTQLSRKQTDGGMSQLLAIAGLDSQFKPPNMWAWSNNQI